MHNERRNAVVSIKEAISDNTRAGVGSSRSGNQRSTGVSSEGRAEDRSVPLTPSFCSRGTLADVARALDGEWAHVAGISSARFPSLARVARLQTRLLFSVDSADMQPSDWLTRSPRVHAEGCTESTTASSWVQDRHHGGVHRERARALLETAAEARDRRGRGAARRTPQRRRVEWSTPCSSHGPLLVPEVAHRHALALRGVRATSRKGRVGVRRLRFILTCRRFVELSIDVEVASAILPRRGPSPFDDRLDRACSLRCVVPGLDPRSCGTVNRSARARAREFGTRNVPLSARAGARGGWPKGSVVVIVTQCSFAASSTSAFDTRVGRRRGADHWAKNPAVVGRRWRKLMISFRRFQA